MAYTTFRKLVVLPFSGAREEERIRGEIPLI
jgi:hypothetical protein